jgi:glycerol-1-phosphate dehydrogenase [NAD(P)+]
MHAPEIVLKTSLAGEELALIQNIFGFADSLAVVFDSNTYGALGERVLRSLRQNSTAVPLGVSPSATQQEAERIMEAARNAKALVAIGSGTINDLTKYAAHLLKIPYVVFPTAPSMNGYVSANASIEVNGYKKTLPAGPPVGVFCDLQVLSQSPIRLIRSGFGDSICRSTAQADWLLSHLVLRTSYDIQPYHILEPYEQRLIDSAEKLLLGDLQAIELLMRTLLLSGEGMRISGSSNPASQGEHMIAHAMHMRQDEPLQHCYHGEEIAVTTLTMAELQIPLLNETVHFKTPSFPHERMKAVFGKHLAKAMAEEYSRKSRLIEASDGNWRRNWFGYVSQIQRIVRPVAEIRTALQRIGALTLPAELGWQDAIYNETVELARFTRNRFGFLDIEAG